MPAFKVPEVPRLGNKIISTNAINNKAHVQSLNDKNKLYLEFFMILKIKLKEILNMEIINHDRVFEPLPNLLRTIDELNPARKPTHRGKRTKKSKNSKSNNSNDKSDLTNAKIINDIDTGELTCSSNILRMNIDDLDKKNVEENNLQSQMNDEKIVKAKKPTHRGRRTKKSKKTKVDDDERNSNEIIMNSMLNNNEITIELIENTTNKLNNLNINKLNDKNDESLIRNCAENTDKSGKNKKPTHRGKRTKKNKPNCDNLKEQNHHDIDEKIMNINNDQSNETSIYKMNYNNLKNDYKTTETIENNYIFDTKNKIFSSNNHQAFIKSQGQIIQIPPEITITPVQKKPQEIIEILPKNDEQVLLKLKKPTHRGKRTKKTKSTKENQSNEANLLNDDQDNQVGGRKRKSKIIDSLEKLDDEVVDKIDEYFTNLIYEPGSFTKLKVENDAKNYTVVSKIAFTNVIRLFFIHAKVPTTEPNLSSVVFRFMHTIIDIHKGRFDMTDVFLTVCEEFFPMGSFNLIALVGYLCAKKWLSLTFLIKCIEYYFTYISESNALFLCVLIKTVEENYDTDKLTNQYWNRFKSITISEKKDLKLVALIEKFNSTKDVWSLLPK
ncbi:hypothetical protein HCN44_009677 [Aphidius gifuensis]|uniref:Uncharacterized protein n=1 Tax=Aphidius gifuensis TaxID=684658 RepID=A0A835CVN9_APHGI|nr:metacaspase-2-like [Aphidius gifuensis]KAF7998279.1 hypothetical protein HCN44_009677 [Aphidius gifuensis]